MVASVAKDFVNTDVVFAVANEGDFPGDLQILGMSDWGEDVAVGLFATKPAKYRMTEELTPSSLHQFVQDYLLGHLEPYLTSELPPREAKNAPVKTVVGSTFKKIVLNPEKNVMVKLYVPLGEACHKAAEWYPKVAEKFQGVNDLVFAEMNVGLNDPPLGTKYDQLPVFYFSARGSAPHGHPPPCTNLSWRRDREERGDFRRREEREGGWRGERGEGVEQREGRGGRICCIN